MEVLHRGSINIKYFLAHPEETTPEILKLLNKNRTFLRKSEKKIRDQDLTRERYEFLRDFYAIAQQYNQKTFDSKQTLEDELDEELSEFERRLGITSPPS